MKSPDLGTLWLNTRDRLSLWWRERTLTEEDRARTIRRYSIGGGAALLALGVGAYFLFRPVPQPDYLDGPMDSLLDYTLLTDEFNALPVEQRMALMGQLIQRFKSMSGEDSVLMASFAAGIAGAARQQIEENAARLMVDVWDKYAKDYDQLPLDNREVYLEQVFVEVSKMMEITADGQPRDVSDSQRINELRDQVAEDRQRLREGSAPPPPPAALGRLVAVMNTNVGSHANSPQRLRGVQMMRDMSRHFRGQDIATGGPK